MTIRPRGVRWQADIYDKSGVRHRPMFATRAEAAAWEAQAKLALSQNKPLPFTPNFIKKNPHMAHLDKLKGLFDYLVRVDWGNAKAARTLIKNGRDVVAYFGENTRPKDITRAAIDNFKEHLATQGATNGTINRKLSALSKMLKIARDFELMDKIPFITWKKEEKTKFRYLDEGEETQLLLYFGTNCDLEKQLMYEFCIFLLDTGARMGELLTLQQGSFDSDNRYVTFWQTKTNKPRTVPLTTRCQSLLGRDRVFMLWLKARTNKSPHAMNKARFQKMWRQMQKDLQWPDVTPHTLRHTCCTRLVLHGVDIKRVMEWMGHSNIKTTSHYMQINPQGLADVVHVLEGKNNEIVPVAA